MPLKSRTLQLISGEMRCLIGKKTIFSRSANLCLPSEQAIVCSRDGKGIHQITSLAVGLFGNERLRQMTTGSKEYTNRVNSAQTPAAQNQHAMATWQPVYSLSRRLYRTAEQTAAKLCGFGADVTALLHREGVRKQNRSGGIHRRSRSRFATHCPRTTTRWQHVLASRISRY
jgi:hypothetical protein